MWASLRRRVYVTPTNYLECVSNYVALLGEKRAELAGKSAKLSGGLLKLDETRQQVGAGAGWGHRRPGFSRG
jgi:dynein heavy chain